MHWLSATNALLCKCSERSLDFKFLATCEANYTLRTAAQKRPSNCRGWCLQSRGEVLVRGRGEGITVTFLGHPAVYDNLMCAWVGPMRVQILLAGLRILVSAKMCWVILRMLF